MTTAAAGPSRYTGSRQVVVRLPPEGERVMLAPRIARATSSNGSYETRGGDRLDLLAHVAFGDSTLWWRLADANPWSDATQLERPGTIIALPDE